MTCTKIKVSVFSNRANRCSVSRPSSILQQWLLGGKNFLK